MSGTDRSITIRLRADVAQALAGLKATGRATVDYANTTAQAAVKNKASWDRVGKAAVVGGALIEAGLLAGVRAAAAFDKAMSTVQANIDDKSAPSLARLRQAALDAGQSTAFSATEAANAENELAKAGVGAADIIGGALHSALVLASAGQIDLESSASILSATMVQFGLHGRDAAHVADLLAAGADKSLGGVQDLGEALKYVGVNAAQFGISVDQTVGVLAQFASYGILGSMAGTGLRQTIIGLTQPTDAARATMQKYGISVFDASGKFVGLDKVAGQLHDKLGSLTQAQQQAALGTIGTNRSITELNILMKEGAQGVDKWTAAVNDQGFASQQASTKLDNLSGDLTKLRNSLNVALIETGQEAQGALRGITQEADHLVLAYNSLSPAAKGTVAAIAGVTGGVLLLGGGLVIAVPRVVEFARALKTVREAAKAGTALRAFSGFIAGPWGLAIAAGTAALAYFVKKHIDAAARVAELTQAVEADSGAIGDNTRAAVVNQLQKQGLLDVARKLGVNLNTLTDAALGNVPATKALNAQMTALQANLAAGVKAGTIAGHTAYDQAQASEHLQSAVSSTNGALKDAVQKAKDHAAAMGEDAAQQSAAAQAGHSLTRSIEDTGGQLKAATFDVTAFDDALKGLYQQEFSVADAHDKLAQGFHDLADSAKRGGTSLKGNSVEAIANRTALRGLTQDAFNLVQAYADTGASSDDVAAKAHSVEKSFLKQAKQILGAHADLSDYKQALDEIPSQVSTNVTVDAHAVGISAASRALGVLQGQANKLHALLGEIGPGSSGSGPHHAGGTTSAPGGLSKVGERGPEWMYVPPGARIWPNGQAPTFPGPQGGSQGPLVAVDTVQLIRGGVEDVGNDLAFRLAARGR